MKDIKFIFTDLDGTLFKSGGFEDNKKIEPSFAEKLNKLESLGVSFSVATGRDYLNAKNILELNGVNNFEYIIGCNGAQVYNKKLNQLIYVRTFSEQEHEYAMKAFEWIDKLYPNQIFMYGYSLGKNMTHITFYRKENENPIVSQAINEAMERFKKGGTGLLIRDSYSTALLKNEYKITFNFVDYKSPIDIKLDITNKLQSQFPNLSFLTSGPIEITPFNIDKHLSIDMVIKKYSKANDNQILVFGDGGNDLSMLNHYPNSYTRKSTFEFVKAITKNVIDKDSSYFVEEIIDKLIADKLNQNN